MFSEKWHYRFMEVARLIATWSKDPNTKTGAIVVGIPRYRHRRIPARRPLAVSWGD